MQKNLIVGCGYIGKLVIQRLSGQVQSLVRSSKSQQLCQTQVSDCGLLDLDDRAAAIPAFINLHNCRILYLVPPPGRGQQDSRLALLLQLLEQKSIEKFVLLSTTGVYGDCAGDWVTEDTPANPQLDRARRRRDAELTMMAFCEQRGIPWVILRVPGIYGPGKLPVKRISSGEPIVRKQDSPFSNRIHAEDLAAICAEALERTDLTGIYNCSDGHPTTMYDFFSRLAELMGIELPEAISLQQAEGQLSAGMMSYMAESRRVSNQKLLSDFHYQLQYPDLEAGLKAVTV
ncbi:MAG: NAD-dependent epimerase/dehydratase family protein [Gammaproteobacteria bacterium]|nr:NAD-dependent epimerase/dehydratase family protein [Gammaproteobacteria bacterium]